MYRAYFMGYEDPKDVQGEPGTAERRVEFLPQCDDRACFTVGNCSNWATENNLDCKYVNGNSDPRGKQ
jgi:hypothetical protein